MSNYWDIRCDTCGVNAGIDNANHRPELMEALARHADAIADLATSLGDEGYLELSLDYVTTPADFFVEHRGHFLVAVSEYGYYNRACAKPGYCPQCKGVFLCSDNEPVEPGRHQHCHTVKDERGWVATHYLKTVEKKEEPMQGATIKPCPACGADPVKDVEERDGESFFTLVCQQKGHTRTASGDNEAAVIADWNGEPMPEPEEPEPEAGQDPERAQEGLQADMDTTAGPEEAANSPDRDDENG